MPAPMAEEVGGSEPVDAVGGDTELGPAVSSGAAVDESIMVTVNALENELKMKRFLSKLSQLLLLSKEVREVNKCANYRPL